MSQYCRSGMPSLGRATVCGAGARGQQWGCGERPALQVHVTQSQGRKSRRRGHGRLLHASGWRGYQSWGGLQGRQTGQQGNAAELNAQVDRPGSWISCCVGQSYRDTASYPACKAPVLEVSARERAAEARESCRCALLGKPHQPPHQQLASLCR